MHSLLESYLAEVAAQLQPLPAKRRNEELREMRVHLENVIVVNRELGMSEDEAAQNAVMQFGTSKDLGKNIVWAWRRGEVLNKRSLFGAAAVTTLVLCLMTFLMDGGFGGILYSALEHTLPRTFLLYCGKHKRFGMALVQGMILMNFGLAGLVAGSLFPKRAMRGACLGLFVYWIGWASVDGIGVHLVGEDRIGWVLSAIVSAWIGSRARLAWRGRTRPVRG